MLLLILSNLNKAGKAQESWSAFFGNEGAEFAYDIRQTSDNGYILAAYGSDGGTSDFYIVRLDVSGDLLWEKTISKDNYSERAHSIVETPEGDFVVIGNATSFNKPWLVKLNHQGDTIWTTQWTDSIANNKGILAKGTILPDGRIVVVSAEDYYALDPYMFIVASDGSLIEERDLFVMKSDPDGNLGNNPIDYVWPGDINYDGIVNMDDLMVLGITTGATGPERNDQSIGWYPHYVTDWADTVVTGVNFKHADTDGNGTVDLADTLAIITNYDSTHASTGKAAWINGLQILTDENGVIFEQGYVVVPLIFGTEQIPATDLYGMSFSMEFDPQIIESGSIRINFSDSWIGNPGNDMLALSVDHSTQSIIDFGITRLNHQSVTGHGFLGTLSFNLDPETSGNWNSMDISLAISNIKAHTYMLEPLAVSGSELLIHIENQITSIDETGKMGIVITPNPVKDNMLVINSESIIQRIMLFNLNGVRLLDLPGTGSRQLVDISGLSGDQFIAIVITTEGYIFSEKILRI